MAKKRNLRQEIEVLKSQSKGKSSNEEKDYLYVKKSLIWSFSYILIAIIFIIIVSIYVSNFPFDYSLRAFFHINRILL